MDERDESLAEAFWAVARRLRERNREALAAWDVTPSQTRALRALRRHGPVRLGDLAEHLRIAPRSATEVVDDLVGRGLVERRPDPADRRAVLVALTGGGEEVVAAIAAARDTGAEAMFGSLPAEDRAHLARILRSLVG